MAAQFAHPIVWLFFGGFALSLAIERHGLHQRLVAAVLRLTGHGPRAALGGVMLATAALSMWVNNTSAALAMLPAGRALIDRWPPNDTGAPRFARAVLLGIAYAATLGGLGTLVGTAPNAFLAAFLQDTLRHRHRLCALDADRRAAGGRAAAGQLVAAGAPAPSAGQRSTAWREP